MKENYAVKLAFLFLGGAIIILLLPFFSLADDVDTSAEVLSFSPPTDLQATVISASQIDLSWSAALKAVSYKVYRDGVFAVSSATISLADTGLSPGTTYSYAVSSVNIYGAESSRSSSVSATTLPGGGGALPPEAYSPPQSPEEGFSILINNDVPYTTTWTVKLKLTAGPDTERMAISENGDFEGAVQELYQAIRDWTLSKGDGKKTIYVKFYTQWGRSSEIVSDSIILDTIAPANVSNFEAVPGDGKITLRWQNPPEADFKEVKITRSTKFYPTEPWEGILFYVAKGDFSEDMNLVNGVTYYYTAFSYDELGNYSSGAIVSATPQMPPVPPVKPPVKPPVEPPIVPPPPEVEKLTLKDFDFWQEDKKLPLVEEKKIKLEEKKPLTASIDYEKAPEVLKTIMVTLGKENKYFSFLLRIDREKTKYSATLLPPAPGEYFLTLSVLDFKNQTLKIISGQILVEKTEAKPLPSQRLPWYKKIINWILRIINWILRIINWILSWLFQIWTIIWTMIRKLIGLF